jgi:fibronectin-binding autotransporter adhesin
MKFEWQIIERTEPFRHAPKSISTSASENPMKTKSLTHLLGNASCILMMSYQAQAIEYWWDSNGAAAGFGNTSGIWGTSAFWNDSSAGTNTPTAAVTNSSDTVNFGTATLNYDNATVAVGVGGVSVNSIAYGAGQTRAIALGTAGNTLTLAGTTPTITVNNTRFHQAILSPIDGSAGLTKAGAGTLVLRGANVYTGGTTVNAGTLSFGTVASKSTSGTHTFNAGTTLGLGYDGTASRYTATDIQNAFAGIFTGNLAGITLDPAVNIAIDTTHAAQTFSANIGTSPRGLVKIANGSNLTVTGANQYSGRTVVSGGSTLIVNSLGNIADSSSNIGTNSTIDMLDASRIDISSNSSSDKHFNLLGGAIIFPGAIAFTHVGNISTASAGSKTVTLATNDTSLINVKDFQGVISNGSGTIAVNKSNSGNIWLSGNNSYTGATSVGGGLLIIGHANALGSTTSGTSVSNGATLGLRGGITTAAESLTLNPGASGAAMLSNFSGNNTWSGNIAASGGAGTNTRIASEAGTLNLGGAVAISGTTHQLVLQGDGNIEITGQITGTSFISSATNGTGVRRLSNDTNSFTGQVRVNGGILEFTSISNLSSACSLGAPSTVADGTINLGFDATAATLRYVGTAVGGHTSERVIHLAGTTGTYTIEANGTGPITLTSNFTAASGSKTLVLSGTNPGSNSIAAIPNGASGTVALTKSGAGTWILVGANTYTGATTISAGTLALGSNHVLPDASAVTIGAGSLDVADFTDTTGTLDVTGAATIDLGTGTIAFADSSAVDWTGGTLNIIGTLGATSLRFGNTSNSLTPAQLGLISVNGSGLGTYTLNASGYLVAGASSAYETWKAANAPGSHPADDTDGDGVSNAVEFVLGGTSATKDLDKLPAVSITDGNLTFTFKRDVDSIDPATALFIETSTDLATWNTSPSPYTVPDGAVANNPGVTVIEDTPAGFDTVTLSVPQGLNAKKFARLKVVVTP